MPYNDDDSSSFFDYRPKQAVPEGEEPPEQFQQHTSSRMSNHSSATPPYDHHESDDDEDDEDDEPSDDDAGSLAELTSYSRDSHGSGVDLHPHHKRSIRHGSGGSVSSNNNYAGHHQLGTSDSRQRKKYSDEENQTSLDNNNHQQPHQRHKSSSRNKRSSKQRSSSRGSSSSSSSGDRSCIYNLFDGVNFKTVLLCVIAMAMVTKMNQPPPHANMQHGMHNDPSSNALRSTALTSANGELPKSHPSHPDFNEDTTEEKLHKLLQNPDATLEEIESAAKARMKEYASNLDPNEAKNGPSAELVQQRMEERIQKRKEERDKNAAELNAMLAGNSGGGEEGTGGEESVGEEQQQPGIPPPPPPVDGQQPGMPPPQGQLDQQYDPSQQQVQQPILQYPQGGQMPPQNLQQQQQGYYQNGYYVPLPPQQPGVAPQFPQQQQQVGGMPPNNYAASGQLPLDPLQQQMQQQQQQVPAQLDPAQQAAAAAVPPPPPPDAAVVAAIPVPPATGAEVTADQVPLVGPNAESALATTSPFALEELVNFKDSWDPYEKTDIPVFWHIPKAGGSSIKDAMGGCHRFVQATEFGITDGHDADTEVAIVYPRVPGDADTDRSPFVNIDSSTVAGIQRAKAMGFADAQLANVVVSPFVFELNDLFTQTAKGRFFSVFRHPIDRAVSMFYYIRVADWEPSYKPELKDWTLEQYAQSDIVENNWMTRQLSNTLGGELTEENLNKAMEVVRRKFLVGLMSQIEPTMARAEKFFRWTFHVNPPNQEACRERLMSGGANSNKANKKEGPKEGDEAWTLLAHQNNFDLRLYAYIEHLFVEQEEFVKGLPDNFRNVDATCCKCYPATFPPEGFECPEPVKNGDPNV